jgi:hypothetical protein
MKIMGVSKKTKSINRKPACPAGRDRKDFTQRSQKIVIHYFNFAHFAFS